VSGTARDVARRALRRVEGEGAYATLALGGELDRAQLSPADRGLATELTYGVLRHLTRLDRALEAMAPRGLDKLSPALRTVLRVAAYQLLFLDRIPAHAAVDDAVRAARKVGGPRMGGLANGLLRRLARDGEPALPPPEAGRVHLEVATSTPPWILDALADVVGEAELPAAAEALGRAPTMWMRATRRGKQAPLAGEAGHAIKSPLVPGAWRLDGAGSPEHHASFQRGEWTVQDVAAQLVALLAAPRPGQRVLDACAGVGGKTLHLAELADDRAAIDAVDRSARKLDLLGDGIRRLGLASITPRVADLLDPAAPLASAYDVIVLDAPCSGLGVLRRHPELKWRLAPEAPAALAATQAALLDAVVARLAPGGVLVYSVCSFVRGEGEAQIAALRARHPGLALDPPPRDAAPWADVIGADGLLRTFPHRHDADGFFAARLRRPA
jgi:16S rRNA (cytosine967-C5)-methyltransferase